MWPYDCFNEYSALINEFNVDDNGDKRRKVFVAKDYGEADREKIIIKAIKKAIPSVEVVDRDSKKIEEDIVRYGLVESMPRKTKKGDINLDILIKIIQARLFIADITPKILKTVSNKKKKGKGIVEKEIVNNNVIFELGLALAWKIPEQVVIIYDAKFDLRKHKLPFDIQGYFCREVSFKEKDKPIKKIEKFIKEHLEDIESKKNIIIKNILSKIDAVSLQLLLREEGRPFPQDRYDLGTIRHLMSLGIINIERYPLKSDGTIDHICYFTELGRFLLKKGLGVNPVDKLFADVVLLRYWKGYKETDGEAYAKKHNSFKLEHGVMWTKCNKFLVQTFHREGFRRSSDIIQLYEDYFRIPKKPFKVFTKEIIKPWLKQIEQYKS